MDQNQKPNNVKIIKEGYEKQLLPNEYRHNIGVMAMFIRDNFWYIIKEYWMWYALLILAFFVGYSFSAAIYSNKCNNILIERGCHMILKPLA